MVACGPAMNRNDMEPGNVNENGSKLENVMLKKKILLLLQPEGKTYVILKLFPSLGRLCHHLHM